MMLFCKIIIVLYDIKKREQSTSLTFSEALGMAFVA